jgi:hypothetical protein
VSIVNDQKGGVESAAFPANGKQGPAALTNNKQEIVDQIQADSMIKRSDVRINRKKYEKIGYPKKGLRKN